MGSQRCVDPHLIPNWRAARPKSDRRRRHRRTLGEASGGTVVHVTLGTAGFNRRTDVFAAVIDALAVLPVAAVVTVGASNDPADLGAIPDNVIAVRYTPIAGLLPRCDVVVSHAGAGTTFATLGHGLPSIFIPLGADQPGIAAAVAAAGAAQVLAPDDLTPTTAGEAIEWALHSQDARSAARVVAAEIAAAPAADIAIGAALALAGLN